jgi:hypothetical protein
MEEYEELLDEAEDEYENSQDLQDGQAESYEATYPQTKDQQSLYNWFWKVVRLNKPFKLAKVGNLDKSEIGEHGIPMREAMNLAHLGQIFHHSKFGNYWATRAKIISASSMARKGWFMELSISQKKVRERQKQESSWTPQKSRLFSKNKNQDE